MMENFKNLLRIAKKLEQKYIIAQKQTSSAQAGDIENALSVSKLHPVVPGTNGQQKNAAVQRELDLMVAPLLDAAKISTNEAVQINLNINPGPKVSFMISITPANPRAAQTLSTLLMRNFAPKMEAAIKNSHLNVSNPVIVKWLEYK